MSTPKDPRFRQLRPILGAKIDALEAAYLSGNPAERQEIDIVLELLRRQATDRWSSLLDPPEGNTADGDIRLGRVLHGRAELGMLGLMTGELLQHALIVGRSGSGKSNLVHHILCQLMDDGIPWLVTDSKRSARDLAAMPGRESIRVASVGRDFGALFRFNPLDPPPGVGFDGHLRRVVELICDTYTGGDGVRQLLVATIERLFASSGSVPTLGEVRDAIMRSSEKGRTGQWRLTTMRIMDHLTSGPLGRVISTVRSNETIRELASGHTILELDGLPRQDASMVVQLILRSLHQSLLASGTREKLRLIVCLEEAQDLAPRRDSARETIVETTMRQARESGMGIMLATQSPSTISPVVLSNCYTVVALNLRSKTDIGAASHGLLLDQDGAAMLSSLPVGQAICRMSGRWPRPVHLKIPAIEVPKGSLDDRGVMARFLSGPLARRNAMRDVPPRARSLNEANDLPVRDSGESGHSAPSPVARQPIKERAGIPPVPLADGSDVSGHSLRIRVSHDGPHDPPLAIELDLLLRDIAQHPLSVVSERYDRLKLSRRKGNAAKKGLIDAGYAEAVPLAVPEGQVVLLRLTEKGTAWCVRRRASIAPLHAGHEHEYWKHRAARVLTDHGWSVEVERAINGHRFDVSATKGHRSVLLECETGSSNYVSNIEHLQRADASHTAVLWLRPSPDLDDFRREIAPIELLRPASLAGWVGSIS